MQKRGLSTVIVSLILIMLSLVAIGVVWVVISNILESSTQETDSTFGGLFLSMDIQKVQIQDDGSVDVTIKRNAGSGTITGIKLVISDGENSETITKEEDFPELTTKKFTIIPDELIGIGLIKEISVVPVLLQSSGEEKIGSVADERTFSNEDLLKNYGAFLWWRFNRDIKDEIDNNHGTLMSGQYVDGKYKQALKMDAINEVVIEKNTSFSFNPNKFTISMWINADPTMENGTAVSTVENTASTYEYDQINFGIFENKLTAKLSIAGSDIFSLQSDEDYNDGNWHHISFVLDNSQPIAILYGDGKEVASSTIPFDANTQVELRIACGQGMGCGCQWNGTIDELIMFNKDLTAKEIESLSKLNLDN